MLFLRLILIVSVIGHALPAALAHEGKEHTALGKEMQVISKNLRVLRRQILEADKKEASLSLLAGMEASAAKAQELVPAKAAEVPEAKRPEFIVAYQKKIGEMIEALKKVEANLRESRFEEAKAGLGALQDLKRKGHEQFSSEED